MIGKRFISKGEFAHDVAIAIQKRRVASRCRRTLRQAITKVLDGPGEPDGAS